MIIQGQLKWCHSKAWVRFPIRIPQQLWPHLSRFYTIHERGRHPSSQSARHRIRARAAPCSLATIGSSAAKNPVSTDLILHHVLVTELQLHYGRPHFIKRGCNVAPTKYYIPRTCIVNYDRLYHIRCICVTDSLGLADEPMLARDNRSDIRTDNRTYNSLRCYAVHSLRRHKKYKKNQGQHIEYTTNRVPNWQTRSSYLLSRPMLISRNINGNIHTAQPLQSDRGRITKSLQHVLFGAIHAVEKRSFQSPTECRCQLCHFKISRQLVPRPWCISGECSICGSSICPRHDIVSTTCGSQQGPR